MIGELLIGALLGLIFAFICIFTHIDIDLIYYEFDDNYNKKFKIGISYKVILTFLVILTFMVLGYFIIANIILSTFIIVAIIRTYREENHIRYNDLMDTAERVEWKRKLE